LPYPAVLLVNSLSRRLVQKSPVRSPENLASNYIWHKCEKFSKSREVKILVNGTEYVYNEHELKKIIKTTMEKETEEK
jgi:hypothetical protein